MAHPFKPNLKNFDCDEIEFDFHLDLSVNKARKVFGNQYSQDTDWDYTAYQEYSVERNKHSCFIVAHNRTKKKIRGKAQIHLDIIFRSKTSELYKLSSQKSLVFLEENAKILINQASDVSVDFLFPPNKFETKPKFPSRYMLTGGLDYAELVGVRINLKGKKGDKKPHASIIIERISDKRIHVRVNFTYIADQTEGLWQLSLGLAYAICEKFLEEKRKS